MRYFLPHSDARRTEKAPTGGRGPYVGFAGEAANPSLNSKAEPLVAVSQHRGDEPAPRADRPDGRTRSPAVLLVDQAGWHLSARLVIPTNITILPCRQNRPSSIRSRTSGSSCGITGSQTHLQILRRSRRPLLRGMSNKLVDSLEDHVHWLRKGARVLNKGSGDKGLILMHR